MKDKLIRAIYSLTWFSARWYQFTMWLSKKPGARVREYSNIEEIIGAMNYGKLYQQDEIFNIKSDHMTHPGALQLKLDNGKGFGDCDDHAIYWCAALLKSGLAKKVWIGIFTMKNDKGYSGHAICVFEDMDHELNWCDYRMPTKIEKMSDFQNQSAERFGKQAICGAIWHVTHLKNDDTPVFGKITKVLP